MTKLTAEARNVIGDTQFAFPAQRKEPLENATHVRNAVSRFNQVRGVSDSEKDAAWQRILDAAGKYDVNVSRSTTVIGTLAASRAVVTACRGRPVRGRPAS